jgi:phage recombination protein Bet
MSNIVPMNENHHAPAVISPGQLALIRRTLAADCNDDEFELFISMAKGLGLNPVKGQIYAFVFNKKDPKKRKLSIVTGIRGLQTIAKRTGNYRPDSEEAVVTYDASLVSPTNPKGIVKATARVWNYVHGEWFPVAGVAYWDEFAPLKQEWGPDPETGERRPLPGRFTLEGKWPEMPVLMIQKCAEAQALRRAFPDEMTGLLEESEIDRARTEEMSAIDTIAEVEREERQKRLGGPSLMLVRKPGSPMEPVPIGKFADAVLADIGTLTPEEVADYRTRNRAAMQAFWGWSKADALGLKAELEKAAAGAPQAAQTATESTEAAEAKADADDRDALS